MVTEQTYSPEQILFDVTSRVRGLEGKYNLLRDRVLIINNNMLEEYKRVSSGIKAIDTDLKILKDDMFKFRESMKHLLKEMDFLARKEDVQFLEKYINLWNPLKFMTQEDVLKLIEEHKTKNSRKEVEDNYAR